MSFYDNGKTFEIPQDFTALNGQIQYFTFTANVKLAAENGDSAAVAKTKQANYLRALEVLKSRGSQPVITEVSNSGTDGVIKFTIEQNNIYGARNTRVTGQSQTDLNTAAVTDVTAAFTNVKALEISNGALVDSATNLFKSIVVDGTIGG